MNKKVLKKAFHHVGLSLLVLSLSACGLSSQFESGGNSNQPPDTFDSGIPIDFYENKDVNSEDTETLIYADSVQVTYYSRILVETSTTWIGSRVYQDGDRCTLIEKRLINNKKDNDFTNGLKSNVNTPAEITTQSLDVIKSTVACGEYVAKDIYIVGPEG